MHAGRGISGAASAPACTQLQQARALAYKHARDVVPQARGRLYDVARARAGLGHPRPRRTAKPVRGCGAAAPRSLAAGCKMAMRGVRGPGPMPI